MTDSMLFLWLCTGMILGIYAKIRGIKIPIWLVLIGVILLSLLLFVADAQAGDPYPPPVTTTVPYPGPATQVPPLLTATQQPTPVPTYVLPTPTRRPTQVVEGATGIVLVDFDARSDKYNLPVLLLSLGLFVFLALGYMFRKGDS